MDPSDHPVAGEQGDIPWMQTDLLGFEDDSFMQSGFGFWDQDPGYSGITFNNDPALSLDMNQNGAGSDWIPLIPSNYIGALTSNGYNLGSNTPRYIPDCSLPDSTINFQQTPETVIPKVQEESEYTYVGIPEVRNRLSSEEWKHRKPAIENLYRKSGWTLEDTRTEMAKEGFHAGSRKIKEWGWETYDRDKDSGNSKAEHPSAKPAKRSRGKAPGQFTTRPASTSSQYGLNAVYEEMPQANSSSTTTVAAYTPPRPPPMSIDHTHASTKIPIPLKDNDFNEIMNTILNNVKDLYISYPAQKKWKVQKHREVEEDIHDDLLVGVATSLRNSKTLSRAVGKKGFSNVLEMVGKVVGVGEGADCGLFSLPSIWISFLRLIQDERPDWARRFLSQALRLAKARFGPKHPFVQVLFNLKKIWKKDPDQIREVVLAAYGRCIEDVKKNLDPLHLTYLSLWGDFVVYLDGRSVHNTQALVEYIQGVVRIVEEEKGLDGGPNSDYALELLGLMLYVLQSAPNSPIMVGQAERVAEDLHRRVEQRRVADGGKLEGDLLIKWKDLKQLLGKFCQDKGDYDHAIDFLEEFLNFEIEDERDALALESLEKCYKAVGNHDAAKNVKQRRTEVYEILLRKTDKSPTEGQKDTDEREKTQEEDEGDVDETVESSEATVVDQAEEWSKENLDEHIADNFADSKVEIQLLEEQIAGLQQRVQALEREEEVRK